MTSSAPVLKEWQPIETAPKDGTVVDLWVRRNWEPPKAEVRFAEWFWCTTHKCWRKADELHWVHSTDKDNVTPLYWMPIPEPPK